MKIVKDEYKGVTFELNTSIGRQRIELATATPEQISLLKLYGIEVDEFFIEIPQKTTVIHYKAVPQIKTKTKKK